MDERRDYFRMDLEAAVELAKLDHAPGVHDDPTVHFATAPMLQVMAELKRLDSEGLQLQQQIKDHDRALGEYLGLMGRKVDILAQYCLNSAQAGTVSRQTVTVSEGGISFHYEDPLAERDWIAVMVNFYQPIMATALHAQIIRCEPDRDGGYVIAAQWRYEYEAQRQQVSQHIMRAQMESIRRQPKQ